MKELTLKDYQEKAMTTCMESSNNFSYMFLNLVGEVGELASKVAKALRKETGMMDGPNFYYYKHQDEGQPSSESLYAELKKEAGDILWQLSGLCSVMGWSLEDVAQMNLDKLAARKAAGTIDGSGDGIIREK
jgi:NTP pyrophosphatase (non-canonical NTP hydrolase)